MTLAALLLALAVLVAPVPRRIRLPHSRSRQVPAAVFVLPLGAVLPAVVVAEMPLGVVIALAAAAATWWGRRRQKLRRRRRDAEVAGLSAALEIVAGELRAGAHPVTAVDAAAREVTSCVALPLRAVAARARLGADVPAGLRSAAVDSADAGSWERLAVIWQLAEAHGLTIATLIGTAHRDIAERQRFSARVTASLAGARTTASILAGLPLLGVGLGHLIGARPIEFLLSQGAGSWFLAVGVVLACCGLVWSDRIADGVSR